MQNYIHYYTVKPRELPSTNMLHLPPERRYREHVLPKYIFTLLIVFLLPISALADLWTSDEEASTDDTPVLTLQASPGDTVTASLQNIEAIGLYDAEFEHFEGLEGRFTGVLLNDLLTAYEMDDVDRVRLLAADGYTTYLSKAERSETAYLLVTRFEGEPVPTNELGPLMLVAPEQADEVVAGTAPMTRWIWSVTDIEAHQR